MNLCTACRRGDTTNCSGVALYTPAVYIPCDNRDDSMLATFMDQDARDRAHKVFLEHERQMQELRDRGLRLP